MAENSKKKSNFSLRRLIYNDKYLIIISLLLAVVIWIVASINIGTDEVKTIKVNVPITLGDEISEQYGMEYYSVQDSIELSVTISGPKYVIGQVTENDLSVNFDSSSVNRTGIQNIPILVTNNSRMLDFDVTNIYPSTVEAFFDINATKTFDIDVRYDDNSVADGYVFGKPILNESGVVVSGPQTYIDKIESIFVNVDFNDEKDLKEPYNADCDLQVSGLGVESSYLTITSKSDSETPLSNVSVTLPVLKETVLPVSADFVGAPAEIGNSVSVRYSVNELNVGVLGGASVKQVTVGSIDYSQLNVGENVFEFDVSNLKGITVLDDVKTVYVYVYVSRNYTQQKVDISNVEATFEGVDDGKKATVVSMDTTNVTVIAPKNANITAADIEITVDVSKKRKDNIYPTKFVVKSNNKAWVFGKINAEVKFE